MSCVLSRLTAATLVLLAGCASPNLLAGLSHGGKRAADPQIAANAGAPPFTRTAPPMNPAGLHNGVEAPFPPGSGQTPSIADNLDYAYRCEQSGRLAEARAAYERVLQQDANHFDAHRRLAVIADKDRRFSDAERHYEMAWRLAAGNTQLRGQIPDLLSDLGYSYFMQGRDDHAEQTLREALRYDSAHGKARDNLCALLVERGDTEQAQALLRTSVSDDEAQRTLAMLVGARPLRPQASQPITAAAPGLRNPFLPPQKTQSVAAAASAPATAAIEARGPAGTPAGASPAARQYPNEETRKLAELMEQRRLEMRRAEEARGRSGAERDRAAQPPISAPPPGNSGRPPMIAGAGPDHQSLSPQQRQQAVLEYLQGGTVHDGEINRRFGEVDSRKDPGATQANRSRRVEESSQWPPGANRAPQAELPNPPPPKLSSPPNNSSPGNSPSGAQTPWPIGPTQGANWNQPQSNTIVPAGGTMPAPQPISIAPVPAARNAWEDARLAAAQMGLQAGPGQLFPVGQTVEPVPAPAPVQPPAIQAQPVQVQTVQPQPLRTPAVAPRLQPTPGSEPPQWPNARTVPVLTGGAITFAEPQQWSSGATGDSQQQIERLQQLARDQQAQILKQQELLDRTRQSNAGTPGQPAPWPHR